MAALDRIAFDSPWSEGAFAAELPLAHSRTLVARGDDSAGAAIGHGAGYPMGYPMGYLVYHRVADEMQILRIAVAPRFRRGGLARILLRRGIADARAEGARIAVLETRPANEPARRLYESFGFHAVGRRTGYYSGTGEDALILTAILKEEE